ncbi:MAG: ATP-binding protein [Rikenellaceae bacterium]
MNDLALHILDIIQNSLSAGARLIKLTIIEDIEGDKLTISIEDNGKGMSAAQVQKLSDPFFTSRTTRRVGLGIPMLKQAAEQSGGEIRVESEPGAGTVVTAYFQYSNIDRPPLGDVANAFILTVSSNPDVEFLLRYEVNGVGYVFDTVEVKKVLEDIPLFDASIIRTLTEMIKENIKELKQ